MRVALMLPVLNPGPAAATLVAAIAAQTRAPDEILVVDSSSTDGWVEEFGRLGARIERISRAEFDHGGTRNRAFSLVDADVYLFLTQDALPADDYAFERLVAIFEQDPLVGAAFGRQLPHPTAGPAASHSRLFNYPPTSAIRTLNDIPRLGVRAAFLSNSFSGYRRAAMASTGFFAVDTIWGEDTLAAAKLLHAGWRIAYVAEARVYHSHDYTFRQEFARYFDMGVLHGRERWYIELLGGARAEGIRFVRAEWRYFVAQGVRWALLRVAVRNGIRWLGYQAGRRHRLLPPALRRMVGMNRGYWR
jgi:rhamnosyltransferase